MCPSSIR